MSIEISAVFISPTLNKSFVCNETSYLNVCQSLQVIGMHVIDHLLLI